MGCRYSASLVAILILVLTLQRNEAKQDEQHLIGRSFCNTFGGCGLARSLDENGILEMKTNSDKSEAPAEEEKEQPAEADDANREDAPELPKASSNDLKSRRGQTDSVDISLLLDDYRTQLDNERSLPGGHNDYDS